MESLVDFGNLEWLREVKEYLVFVWYFVCKQNVSIGVLRDVHGIFRTQVVGGEGLDNYSTICDYMDMSEILAAHEFPAPRDRSSVELFLDGRIHRLVQGQDYQKLSAIRSRLKILAKRLGVRVEFDARVAGALVVRAIRPVAEQPVPDIHFQCPMDAGSSPAGWGLQVPVAVAPVVVPPVRDAGLTTAARAIVLYLLQQQAYPASIQSNPTLMTDIRALVNAGEHTNYLQSRDGALIARMKVEALALATQRYGGSLPPWRIYDTAPPGWNLRSFFYEQFDQIQAHAADLGIRSVVIELIRAATCQPIHYSGPGRSHTIMSEPPVFRSRDRRDRNQALLRMVRTPQALSMED